MSVMVENGQVSYEQKKTYLELLGMIGVTNKCNTEIFMGKFQLPLTFVCFNNCTEEEFPAIRKAF